MSRASPSREPGWTAGASGQSKQPFGPAGTAAQRAQHDCHVEVIDIESAAGKPGMPFTVQFGTELIAEAAADLCGHFPPYNMVQDGYPRRPDALEHRIAAREAGFEFSAGDGLERQTGQGDNLEQLPFARQNRMVIDLGHVRQMCACRNFMPRRPITDNRHLHLAS